MLEQVRDRTAWPTIEGPLAIRDLLRIPERFLRSVQLERDFHDPTLLRQYILTAPMARALGRIAEGLRPGSGRRAWRITGDYGVGKSSFALILAHLLRDPKNPDLAAIRRAIGFEVSGSHSPGLLPVLVTGAREAIVPAIARGVERAIRSSGYDGTSAAYAAIGDRASAIARDGDADGLLELLGDLARAPGTSGAVLVLDELGKFLEHASLHPDREDIYVLQRLAELASRSGARPIILLGLLHQGFHAYAERLPSVARQEWDKVAGRFEEITFDQPLAHTAALVAGALNVESARVPPALAAEAVTVMAAALSTGWYGAPGRPWEAPDPLALFPLHPTVLPVLIRFFARFGQHERSLFSFLLSSEPFGLQSFAERPAEPGNWFRLADFYDYVRATFGHRLAGASFRSQWLRIAGILDSVDLDDPLALRVLKTVAVLNVLDVEQLLPTDAVLGAAIGDDDGTGTVTAAIAALRARGMLHERGAAGGYRLWPYTSINLETQLVAAARALGPLEEVAVQLETYLDTRPLVARRHYIATGTLRHFEVRYAGLRLLGEAMSRPTEADGLVVIALCDSAADREEAIAQLTRSDIAERSDVLVAVSAPLLGLAGEVQDVRRWQWVAQNTPELSDDVYAMAEVARESTAAQQLLANRLTALVGLRGGEKHAGAAWWRAGQPVRLEQGRRLQTVLSEVCDELYPGAPLIRNELLNRRSLSSAAVAARMRLIERMFTAADQPMVGIKAEKAPPEKSMYLSVLAAGHIHVRIDDRYTLQVPPENDDQLRLRPTLTRIVALLHESDGHRVPVPRILYTLQNRPFGVRAGLAPLLLAIVATAHAHEIAVYEHGTFLPRFGTADFLRLIKQPSAFELQLSRVTGVRAEVFWQLTRFFAPDLPVSRQHNLLDVVRPLTVFAAGLPIYTRQANNLGEAAQAVRDALLTAREPTTLIFRDLPVACGLKPFADDEPVGQGPARRFVDALREALEDLRSAYPRLLERIRERLARRLADGRPQLDRAEISTRAAQVALVVSEPRLQAFARSLADTALPDEAWAERLGSFVVAKPPARWTASDETRAADEIDLLGGGFVRVEAMTFGTNGQKTDMAAVRIALTRADGHEAAQVVYTRPEDESAVRALAERLEATLSVAEGREVRLAALARVLKDSIAVELAKD